MNHNTLGRFGGWALLVLAATQGLLLGLRPWPGSVASDPWLAAGDHLPYSKVHDALGRGAWAPSPAPLTSTEGLSLVAQLGGAQLRMDQAPLASPLRIRAPSCR